MYILVDPDIVDHACKKGYPENITNFLMELTKEASNTRLIRDTKSKEPRVLYDEYSRIFTSIIKSLEGTRSYSYRKIILQFLSILVSNEKGIGCIDLVPGELPVWIDDEFRKKHGSKEIEKYLYRLAAPCCEMLSDPGVLICLLDPPGDDTRLAFEADFCREIRSRWKKIKFCHVSDKLEEALEDPVLSMVEQLKEEKSQARKRLDKSASVRLEEQVGRYFAEYWKHTCKVRRRVGDEQVDMWGERVFEDGRMSILIGECKYREDDLDMIDVHDLYKGKKIKRFQLKFKIRAVLDDRLAATSYPARVQAFIASNAEGITDRAKLNLHELEKSLNYEYEGRAEICLSFFRVKREIRAKCTDVDWELQKCDCEFLPIH